MYPVTYAVENPGEERDRLTVIFRPILAIPWLIVLGVYGLVAYLAAVGAWFSIVFTGSYPRGLYDFVAGFIRFLGRLNGFAYLATDDWPPFHGNPDESYPVRVGTPEPLPEYDRLKTGLRLIFAIPVMLLANVQALVATVIALIGWFAILFTGRLSDDLFGPLRSALAYDTRATAYFMLLTEEWPPFSLEQPGGTGAQLPPSTSADAKADEGSAATPERQSET